jgi:hypothetical protein
MVRSYEVNEIDTGWKLTMYEAGEEVGAALGGPNDYEWLLERGEEFKAD